MTNNYYKNRKGFTLVELLVVISILGILATIGLVAFSSAQARGRDTQRKSDLKQISTALELYYSDYQVYPASSNDGEIMGCPSAVIPKACVWGGSGTTSEFTDGKTTYFQHLPKDPSAGIGYYYRVVDPGSDGTGSKFQIFAYLENSQDPQIITTATSYPCGTKTCNFALTSSNTSPSE
jgi:prepilin-type N-terminal cleavage/methylation domain-containing protein